MKHKVKHLHFVAVNARIRCANARVGSARRALLARGRQCHFIAEARDAA